jgi:hypothetical protein
MPINTSRFDSRQFDASLLPSPVAAPVVAPPKRGPQITGRRTRAHVLRGSASGRSAGPIVLAYPAPLAARMAQRRVILLQGGPPPPPPNTSSGGTVIVVPRRGPHLATLFRRPAIQAHPGLIPPFVPDDLQGAVIFAWNSVPAFAPLGKLYQRRQPAGTKPPFAVLRSKTVGQPYLSNTSRVDDVRLTIEVTDLDEETAEDWGELVYNTFRTMPLFFEEGNSRQPFKIKRDDVTLAGRFPGNVPLYKNCIEFMCRVSGPPD